MRHHRRFTRTRSMTTARIVPPLLLLCIAVATAAAQQRSAPADQIVADFDAVSPSVSVGTGLRLTEIRGDDGDLYLRVTAADGGPAKGTVLFNVPDGLKPSDSAGLAVQVGAAGGRGSVKLRWLALDANNRVILQRRFDFKPDEPLKQASLPWTRWRWGDVTGGGPSEVRRIGFRIEEPADELRLDDLRLTGRAAPPDAAAADASPREWLRRVAFGERDVRMAEADGLLVATDAPDLLSDADLTGILARMRAGRAMTRRLFGDAVRPVEGSTPPALLVFRRHGGFVAFFESLSTEWNVRVVPPLGGGMTVQNLAASVFDPKQGPQRPVFLHESIHAVVANDVRLLNGNPHHSWLQEGLASYVQLCVYPGAVDRADLAANFARPIKPDGSGFFKPLDRLLDKLVTPPNYAQLATLVAYLVQDKPQWLPVLAKELTAGRTAEQAFAKCGTSLADLQSAWMKWGAAMVKDGDAGARLPLPREFAELTNTK